MDAFVGFFLDALFLLVRAPLEQTPHNEVHGHAKEYSGDLQLEHGERNQESGSGGDQGREQPRIGPGTNSGSMLTTFD